ncbi:MAG: hypothetical protein IJB25_05530, partial [Clostridia bacterium]|nr:hypothetical protein [Clostridia bacterium]
TFADSLSGAVFSQLRLNDQQASWRGWRSSLALPLGELSAQPTERALMNEAAKCNSRKRANNPLSHLRCQLSHGESQGIAIQSFRIIKSESPIETFADSLSGADFRSSAFARLKAYFTFFLHYL